MERGRLYEKAKENTSNKFATLQAREITSAVSKSSLLCLSFPIDQHHQQVYAVRVHLHGRGNGVMAWLDGRDQFQQLFNTRVS